MKTYIIVNLEIEGLHSWPEAKDIFPDVAYLSNLHRHIFHIECVKKVTHDNRDIEIIRFKRKIKDYLFDKYFDHEFRCCNFKNQSCEMIGKELFNNFILNSCKILEDGENGALTTNE